jgi:CMP-N-acetylneuraminic acid synthetase
VNDKLTNSPRPEVWAWIPARGGSKGIPDKNIRPLAGKPLIAYTIEAARRCPSIDRVLVSTDSPRIARVARRFGAEVPFLRPASLAGDRAHVTDAYWNLLEGLTAREGRIPGRVMTLFATHPFRTPALLERVLAETRRAYYVHTVVPATLRLDRLLDVRGRPLAAGASATAAVKPLGLATAFHYNPEEREFLGDAARMTASWRRLRARGVTRRTRAVLVTDPIMRLDIDEPEDLAVAEEVIRRRLFDFERGAVAHEDALPVPS